jgi:hypothetical protein
VVVGCNHSVAKFSGERGKRHHKGLSRAAVKALYPALTSFGLRARFKSVISTFLRAVIFATNKVEQEVNEVLFSTVCLLTLITCLFIGRIVWLTSDEHIARCLVAAFPTLGHIPPSTPLGQAVKVFVTAVLLFYFVECDSPGLGSLGCTLKLSIEHSICAFCSFVFQTIWNACS